MKKKYAPTNPATDKRIKKFIIFDTEFTKEKLVYDFGYTICDGRGNIYAKRNYFIEEIFCTEKIQSAFYYKKMPIYLKKVASHEVEVLPWNEVLRIVETDLEKFQIKTLIAFFAKADKESIETTHEYVNHEKFSWSAWGHLACLWNIACETICSQKKYIKMCYDNDWLTEKGYPKTNAETVYKYISNQPQFVEAHTALEDSIIETQIFKRCIQSRLHFHWDNLYNQGYRLVAAKAEYWGFLNKED